MGVRMSLPYCTRACVQPYPVGCTVPRLSGTRTAPESPNKSRDGEGGSHSVDHTTPYRQLVLARWRIVRDEDFASVNDPGV